VVAKVETKEEEKASMLLFQFLKNNKMDTLPTRNEDQRTR
jgi:hypothetical protein